MNKILTLASKPFVITSLLTLALLWPLFKAPYFTHHDDIQIIRLDQMNKCIRDRQIPCRWVPDLGGLYGYPLFNYYGPLPYYFGGIFYLITGSLLISAKIMFATAFLGSFIFMYLLTRKFWGELGGSLSALLYSYAPYHAVDFYVRGAMGELWALMLFPAIFWALLKLSEKRNLSNVLLLSPILAALFLSHNLSTMIFMPVVLIFGIFLYPRIRSRAFIWLSLGSLLLGILLASFYLIPMAVEKNLVHVDTTTVGYFSYTEHFKGVKKLFLERSWGWGSSVREVPQGAKDGLSYQIGWVHILGWVLALICAKLLWKKNNWSSRLIFLFSILTVTGIFMIHPRSEFVWKIFEPLKFLQFPWRFLSLVIFFISIVSGSIMVCANKRKRLIWWTGVLLVVALNFLYFQPEKFLQVSDRDYLTGENWVKQIKRSIYDYLPIYAKEPPAELAGSRYEVLAGDVQIRNFKEGTNWIEFDAQVDSHTIIRLSQYYFPQWRFTANGKELNVEYENNNLGLMNFILGKGNYHIQGRLYDTPIRTVSNLLTVIGIAVYVLLFFLKFKRIRQWIMYYRRRAN